MFREREKSFDNSMVQTGKRKSCHSDQHLAENQAGRATGSAAASRCFEKSAGHS
jgi:hypothetical protein